MVDFGKLLNRPKRMKERFLRWFPQASGEDFDCLNAQHIQRHSMIKSAREDRGEVDRFRIILEAPTAGEHTDPEERIIDAALKATGLPIIKWQRRSKRVVTVWIARKTPPYFDHPYPTRRGKSVEQYWHEYGKRLEMIDGCKAIEADWWKQQVDNFAAFEYYACYPARDWVHLTVKCPTLFPRVNPYEGGGVDNPPELS